LVHHTSSGTGIEPVT